MAAARTPLFAWVERSLRLARASADTGLAPDDLVITNGAFEAVNLCLRAVCRPGDVVAPGKNESQRPFRTSLFGG